MKISVGILTVSDRSSQGTRKDLSGPALSQMVQEQGWKISAESIVPDEIGKIRETLLEWSDELGILVILTTGGTGIGPRDVTPEATVDILDKKLPGLSELIRQESIKKILSAALSRATAGVRRKSLIVNLPGNPEGAKECLGFILELIPHALTMIAGGDHVKRENTHDHA